jgi:hypothetical protein
MQTVIHLMSSEDLHTKKAPLTICFLSVLIHDANVDELMLASHHEGHHN